jgi:glycosyltransferase involved in cell wall biosynthesis
MDDKRISLYIPCFNASQFIEACIEGVLAQTYPVDEILVIDDGSHDGTSELASQYPVKIIKHKTNQGLAAARNTAFKSSNYELVASLDADCIPAPEWLATLVPLIENSKVGAVGGRLVETVFQCNADYWRNSHLCQDWGDSWSDRPTFVFGNNNIMRKSAVMLAGGYDEAMRTNGEDADVSKRLRDKGYCLIYEPKALVYHKRQDTLSSILDTYWRYWRFGAKAYFGKTSASDLLRHCIRHFFVDFRVVIEKDIRCQNYSLLWADLLLPVYMIRRDIGEYLKQLKDS